MTPTITCSQCGYNARDNYNLKRHQKSHDKVRCKKLTCPVCGYAARDTYNLTQHKLKHVDRDKRCRPCGRTFSTVEETHKHLESCQRFVTCWHCNKRVSNKTTLRIHMRRIHFSKRTQTLNKQCPLCSTKCSSTFEIDEHLTVQHGKNLEKHILNFESKDDFFAWKEELENATNCSYSNRHSKKNSLGSYRTYFHCHRSGFAQLKSSDSRQRELKSLGSNKMNAYCPARLYAAFSKDGSVIVNGITTHVGHDFHPGRRPLSKQLREDVASKIAMNISFKEILSSCKSNIEESLLNRDNLITQKDLHNIVRDFKLDQCLTMPNDDWENVRAWVHMQIDSATNFIRYAKFQGELDPQCPQLDSNDFILVLMSDSQVQVLKEFGKNIVCLDGTRFPSSCNIDLTTLLVMDHRSEGFPCAFLFSSRSDIITMSFFISVVAGLSGPVTCEVFMSDIVDVYYDSWVASMGPPRRHLHCSWHVDKAWRKNLGMVDKSVQCTVYTLLKAIQIESDESKFTVMFNKLLIDLLGNEKTDNFGNYMLNCYSHNKKSWAHCFRRLNNINTNTVLERVHALPKHFYVNGKHIKRMDKAVHAIETFHRDKIDDLFSNVQQGDASKNIPLIILLRHKTSVEADLVVTLLTENEWLVSSSTQSNPYSVQQIKNTMCDNCPRICEECQACSDMYICSCLDNALQRNMCIHIHAVCCECRSKPPSELELLLEDTQDIIVSNVDPYSVSIDEIECQDLQYQLPSPNRSIEDAKEKMNALIETATNNEQIAAVYEAISSLGVRLAELETKPSLPLTSPLTSQSESPYDYQIISSIDLTTPHPTCSDEEMPILQNEDGQPTSTQLFFTFVETPTDVVDRETEETVMRFKTSMNATMLD